MPTNRPGYKPAAERKPVVGPYATCVFDPVRKRWYGRLTADGQRKVEEFLGICPSVTAMMYAVLPKSRALTQALGVPADELEAVARMAVVSAVIRWDPARVGRGGKTAGLTTVVVWNLRAAISHLCNTRPTITAESIDAGDGAHFVIDRKSSDPAVAIDGRDAVELTAALTDRQRQIVSMRYGIGGHERTLEEIARELGISKERVRQALLESLYKIRARLVPACALALDVRIAEFIHSRPCTLGELMRLTAAPRTPVERALVRLERDGVALRTTNLKGTPAWTHVRCVPANERAANVDSSRRSLSQRAVRYAPRVRSPK